MTPFNAAKIETLIEIEGYSSSEDMFAWAVFDSIAPAICINEGCDYCEAMEPDQTAGWCPECETNTVQSCLIIAGII